MDDSVMLETEDQTIARVRGVKVRAALRAAPETAMRLRARAIPTDGRTESGVVPGDRTPLLTDITDAADELFVTLRDWAEVWETRLRLSDLFVPPTWMRPSDGTPLGFRPGTTPQQAHALVTAASSWLLWHDTEIGHQDGAAHYQDDVARRVGSLRWKAGLDKGGRVREVSPRPCPVCGSEVMVSFFGEPIAQAEARDERLRLQPRRWETEDDAANKFFNAIEGVGVSCAACGWVPDASTTQIARWLA